MPNTKEDRDRAKEIVDLCLCDLRTLEMVEKPNKEDWIKTTIKEEIRVSVLKERIDALQTALTVLSDYEKMEAELEALKHPTAVIDRRVKYVQETSQKIAKLEAENEELKEKYSQEIMKNTMLEQDRDRLQAIRASLLGGEK